MLPTYVEWVYQHPISILVYPFSGIHGRKPVFFFFLMLLFKKKKIDYKDQSFSFSGLCNDMVARVFQSFQFWIQVHCMVANW